MQNTMEIPPKTSRKRKQSSSTPSSSLNTPFSGVLTRQKSQKFFCSRNRSGKSRQCSSIRYPSVKSPAKSLTRIDGDDDGGGVGSVKDLRLRRVFSKPVEKGGFGCDELVDCKVDCFGGVAERVGVLVDEKFDSRVDVGNPSFSILKKCDSNLAAAESISTKEFDDFGVNLVVDDDLVAENLNFGNPNFSILKKCDSNLTAGESISSKEFDEFAVNLVVDDDLVGENPNFGNPNLTVLKQCDDDDDDSGVNLGAEGLIVETIDSTLNCDSRVSDDTNPNLSDEFVKGEVVGEKCEVMNEENVLTTPPDAVFINRKSDEESRLVSRSCVSRSLDKQISPTKDRSSSVKEMTLNKCSRRKIFKVPNSYTYKRLLPYLMDMAKDEPCTLIDNPSVKIEIDVPKSPEKPLATVEACGVQVMSTVETNELPSDLKASSPADRSPANLVSNESQIPDDQKQDVSPDNLVAAFYSPKTSNEISKEDASFDVGIDDMEFKREEGSICKLRSSNSLGTPVSSDALVGGMTKGIMKRNPWGCRGICSCLNCTSFRLNAEKAFEFSRNQLLEAEEVAQNLMKELSNLKCMLKKTVTGVAEVGAVTHNQVEEACQRASNVEDMAKARSRQMHEDLFVHSRTKALQRPRVNFSGNVRESVTEDLTHQTDAVRVGMNPDLS